MNIEEDSVRLRTIAAAVMNGDCPRDEYLVERRRLIDLHAGEASPDVPVAELDESVFLPADTTTRPVPVIVDEDDHKPVAASERHADRPHDLLLGIAVLFGVLGLLWGLIAWLW